MKQKIFIKAIIIIKECDFNSIFIIILLHHRFMARIAAEANVANDALKYDAPFVFFLSAGFLTATGAFGAGAALRALTVAATALTVPAVLAFLIQQWWFAGVVGGSLVNPLISNAGLFMKSVQVKSFLLLLNWK